ncbi:hypothetical protein Kpol_463p13 [Vanderwaltozyma polyspora DSM 70294]|uniref:Ribosome-releasing factor 2, mitochondrial n=1 Tax=Vanderwaltozyma polyspora (strain ATCC 22028 / DSM 70294 / BCRC 21397 / CBS 2163 / NBRC 10782 / NRRL Y-8283 / UCD 57-17) TaxID=436907 RepID=RRF2M_VANPO|nr:uncharacterized protein Kpol_463p13 [Vanderwaltozyma polyspora DSM 70294]A7TQJ9.1 RecName: Full=Ribosome-releasing factor 2, mitochondrial; Short=RRF2mt; AltName: Full=Elongation factor G 2, mitochondrial; Short=EF-G2mt; Short=mEF-G 2 [Vanderwaltozyma polyspora DSM 70294]EDO15463.1 hypothetical protein Kpol_463p13 [Vanderwaltozyma polyspora DSM 70294]
MFGFGIRQLRGYASKTDLSKIRNIGIIAHIDAGKTTTTERMLYYSGKTNRIGNVDQGDTVTDYLPQERSRGITIQSAAISFNWQNDHRINLIDTPGHVDFTFEVIKSLKVLDGCVTILDAVAGVEAQTEKVWKQSYGIPKICYINKMDRVGSGYSRTVKELMIKMNQRVVLANMPLFKLDPVTNEQVFEGVLDVVNMKALRWDSTDVNKVDIADIDKFDSSLLDELTKAREAMVETLSEFDENLVEHFLEDAEGDYLKVSPTILNSSIRKSTLSQDITPILCGSSFRNIGVQPLLDAVVNYLPSPLEAKFPELNEDIPISYDKRKGLLFDNNSEICVAFAFKVITDEIRGQLVFVRVYSGTLKNGHSVYNSTNGKTFKINKPVIMHANKTEDVQSLSAGEIGVLTGSTVFGRIETGDTLISHSMVKDGLKSIERKGNLNLKINPIIIPPPVFSVYIEPKTLGNRKAMEAALKILVTEDPSLHVSQDEETSQTLLSGMGELHLEIARDKLLNDLKAEVGIGKLMISYKETINSTTNPVIYQDDIGYKFTIQIEPLEGEEVRVDKDTATEAWYPLGVDNNYLIFEKSNKPGLGAVWKHQIPYDVVINTIKSSCLASFQRGGKIGGYALHSCAVRIKGDFEVPYDATSSNEILNITRKLIIKSLQALHESSYSLLEPIMDVEIVVNQKFMGEVIQDLTGHHKANILSIEDEHGLDYNNERSTLNFKDIVDSQYLPPDITLNLAKLDNGGDRCKVIKAEAPLKEMVSYSNKLRSLTEGRGMVYMNYHGMKKVTPERLDDVLQG